MVHGLQKQYIYVKQMRSVVCAAVEDVMEFSFIIERENYQRSFFIFIECILYLLDCVCLCVKVCMCISNNDAFREKAFFCSEYFVRAEMHVCAMLENNSVLLWYCIPTIVQGSVFIGHD
jgi:hypothetical protein